MKKLYLLSGMIILSVFASLSAMQQQRPLIPQQPNEIQQQLNEIWRQLDEFTDEPINWEGVFRVLEFYRHRMPAREFNNLVNQYRDPFDGDRLLMLAVDNNNVPAAHRLLKDFNAQVTKGMMDDAKGYGRNNQLLELLYQYGGAQ
ncbi:MAG TPA: hypothetical protein VHX42_03075 [Candidatus Babeliales bacterium]|jgi:hypothetical protein|nr:hypothetical protein [Candidatus Babeliales bacterium]